MTYRGTRTGDGQPIGPRRLSDVAYSTIRGQILEGAIRPGAVLREPELAEALDMSRTPVREALRRIEAEGLVLQASRGYLVAQLDPSELRDIYGVRAVLEGFAAELAAEHRTRADLGSMEDLIESMDRAHRGGDHAAFLALGAQFHEVITRAGRNRYLEGLLAQARELYDRFRPVGGSAPGREAQALAEHKALWRAIAESNPQVARNAAVDHAQHGLGSLLGDGPESAASRSVHPDE